jgi:hypothetical protein
MEIRQLIAVGMVIAGIGALIVGAMILGGMDFSNELAGIMRIGLGVVIGMALAMAIDVALGRR